MEALVRSRVAADCVALTFDDGPSPWTPFALDELARAEAQATFFVTPGTDADLVLRMVTEGHEVGYHCGEHVRHSERGPAEVREEVRRDLDWLGALGVRPRAWRPPWGDLAPWSAELAEELGMEIWLWSNDTNDWDGRSTETMLAHLAGSVGPGSVILMHDGLGPGCRRSDPLATVALICPVIELCRPRGLRPVLVGASIAAHA